MSSRSRNKISKSAFFSTGYFLDIQRNKMLEALHSANFLMKHIIKTVFKIALLFNYYLYYKTEQYNKAGTKQMHIAILVLKYSKGN